MRIQLNITREDAKDSYQTKEVCEVELNITADLIGPIVTLFAKALEVHLQNRVHSQMLGIQPDQTASRCV